VVHYPTATLIHARCWNAVPSLSSLATFTNYKSISVDSRYT